MRTKRAYLDRVRRITVERGTHSRSGHLWRACKAVQALAPPDSWKKIWEEELLSLSECMSLHPSLTHHRKINPFKRKVWEIRGAFNKFPDFFLYRHLKLSALKNRLLKIQYAIAIRLIRWLTNFYDSRFKWTATPAIGIHPTKAWLSQLVNF